MQFQYSAKNIDGKASTGFVNAEDFEQAKSQLESMGFSIDYLKESDSTEVKSSNFAKYKFKGTNKDGKTVRGTIESENITSGIARLIDEYELVVELFGIETLSDQEFQETNAKVLEVTEQLKNRPEPKVPTETKNKKFEVSKEVDYVENLMSLINYILNRFDQYLKPSSKTELQESLAIFEKTRYSDNKEKLQSQAKDLINHILNDDLFQDEYDLEDSPEINNLHNQATELLFIEDTPATQILKSINIIFTTKSNLTRKLIWNQTQKLFKSILSKFFQNTKKSHVKKSDFQINVKVEKQISDIVFIVTQAYLAFYFLGYLIGNKLKFNFNIFETNFLIYIILLSLFTQAALKFDLLINKKHGTNSIIIFTMFAGLYGILITKL